MRVSRRHLLLILPLAASWCHGSQDTPVKNNNLATLEGRAFNSVSGEPLADQGITLRALSPGTEFLTVQSDEDGHFRFEDMPPGAYILCVRAFGDDGIPITLKAGQVHRGVEFKVVPTGSISGTVVDQKGEPVPRVLVSASAYMSLGTTSSTNASGEFRLPNLLPGNYVLRAVSTQRAAGAAVKSKERLLPTYYPAATEAAGAVPVTVAGGEIKGITIVLQLGAVYRVQGTVTSLSQDTEFAGVGLTMVPRQIDTSGRVPLSGISLTGAGQEIRSDGSFDLNGIAPGSYYLTASRRSRPPVILGRVPVDIVDSDVVGVVLRLGNALQIDGAIRMDKSEKADFSGARVQFRPLRSPGAASEVAVVDAQNTFTLKDVSPTEHTVSVTGLPETAYVKAIRLGGRQMTASALDLTDMLSAPPLEILISPNGATIDGIANRDIGEPVPGAWVCLMPDPAPLVQDSRIRQATATGEGKFVFAGVPPGEYRLYAFEPLRRDPYGDYSFLKPFESNATKLSVKEGERKQVNLTVHRLAAGY